MNRRDETNWCMPQYGKGGLNVFNGSLKITFLSIENIIETVLDWHGKLELVCDTLIKVDGSNSFWNWTVFSNWGDFFKREKRRCRFLFCTSKCRSPVCFISAIHHILCDMLALCWFLCWQWYILDFVLMKAWLVRYGWSSGKLILSITRIEKVYVDIFNLWCFITQQTSLDSQLTDLLSCFDSLPSRQINFPEISPWKSLRWVSYFLKMKVEFFGLSVPRNLEIRVEAARRQIK